MKWWPFAKRVPKRQSVRMYEAARQSRLTADWYSANSSEDSELSTSLRMLRQRSRSLVRDNPYAKRVRTIVCNNVVGTGIGLQAAVVSTRGRLNNRVNDEIEALWKEWCQPASCHTGSALHFSDLERLLMGQVVEAGEVFVRKHYDATGKVPLRLEIVEPERLAEDYEAPEARGITTKMGVEVDGFGKPLAYWIRELHPGEIRRNIGATDKLIRVPAEQMIHLRIIDRWPQTRGVPWFHAAAKRLRDMDGYTEAEIVAARMSATYMGFIKSPEPPAYDDKEEGSNKQILEFDAGIIQHLAPGEEFQGFAPNRPNAQLDPFMRYMLREVASSVGVSYESLSRDYSQSNYSSSRLALLDDRDLWKTLQQWFIRSFREPLYREWLGLAVMAGALQSVPVEQFFGNRAKFEAVQFKPRGWGWVDPTKEVAAYKEAVLAGFTTTADVIAATANGADLEDVLNGRRRELDMMEALDLKFDTEVEEPPAVEAAEQPAPEPDPEPDTEDEDESAEAMRAIAAAVQAQALATTRLADAVAVMLTREPAQPNVSVNFPAGSIQSHVSVEQAAAPQPITHVTANVVPIHAEQRDDDVIQFPFRMELPKAGPAGEPEAQADGNPAPATLEETNDQADEAACA